MGKCTRSRETAQLEHAGTNEIGLSLFPLPPLPFTLRSGDGGYVGTEVKLMTLSKSDFEAHLDVLRPQLQDLLAFNVLRSIPLLKDVKSLQLMTVLEQFKETRVYKPGETIVQAGIMGQHLYIALQGNMEVVVGGYAPGTAPYNRLACSFSGSACGILGMRGERAMPHPQPSQTPSSRRPS
jgi:hypothetical protein